MGHNGGNLKFNLYGRELSFLSPSFAPATDIRFRNKKREYIRLTKEFEASEGATLPSLKKVAEIKKNLASRKEYIMSEVSHTFLPSALMMCMEA